MTSKVSQPKVARQQPRLATKIRTNKSAMSLVVASLGSALLLVTLGVGCEPSQQQQTQYNELSSQEFGSYASDPQLASLGARGPYTNAKRARKMSAFMPMRGRKDGRDLVGADSLRDSAWEQLRLRQQLGEPASSLLGPWQGRANSDSSDEANLLRRLGGAGDGGLPVALVPRQFLNQFERHLAKGADLAGSLAGQRPQPTVGPLVTRGGAPGPSAFLMDAKLRRAFHPMRGKKWAPQEQRDAGPAREASPPDELLESW